MNLLTIARRADFGYFLTAHFEDVRSRLKAGASYRDVVKTSVGLDKTQTQFHEFTYLTGLASLAEAMVVDSATAFLSRYPGHLTDKGVPLATLAEAGSRGGADCRGSLRAGDSAGQLSSALVAYDSTNTKTI